MNFQEDFIQAMKIIFKNEGIYSNDQDDPGGETFLGIARNYHPDWEGWKIIDNLKKVTDIDNLTIQEIKNMKDLYNKVLEFYYNNFWVPLHLNEINGNVKISIFDGAVNMGVGRTKKILQEALGVIPDGIIGPKTLEVLHNINPNLLECRFKLERIKYYTDLCYRKPIFKKYLLGWINRSLKT